MKYDVGAAGKHGFLAKHRAAGERVLPLVRPAQLTASEKPAKLRLDAMCNATGNWWRTTLLAAIPALVVGAIFHSSKLMPVAVGAVVGVVSTVGSPMIIRARQRQVSIDLLGADMIVAETSANRMGFRCNFEGATCWVAIEFPDNYDDAMDEVNAHHPERLVEVESPPQSVAIVIILASLILAAISFGLWIIIKGEGRH